MSVLFGSSDDVIDHGSLSETREESVSVALIYWSAIFASAGITVLGFWKLIELFT